MFCTKCGAANSDGNKFCTGCGAPLKGTPSYQSNQSNTYAQTGQGQMPPVSGTVPTPQMRRPANMQAFGPAMNTVPLPPAAVASPQTAMPTASTVPTASVSAKAKPSRLIIALIAVLAVLVVAGITLFATWKAELWGGRTLPDPASIVQSAAAEGGKPTTIKAKDVTDALKQRGFNARTEKVFSGKDVGAFAGYKESAAGSRIPSGSTVTVQESAGPGVPQDTMGKPAKQVQGTLEDMGVPVHYKQVYVSDTKKTPEGTVVATDPVAGQGLAEDKRDDGIYVGVATKGDGFVADIVGQDVKQVQKNLESMGYNVAIAPRLSTSKNVGKVTGSNPAPGSSVPSKQQITLYYGVDAKGVRDAFTFDSPETGHKMMGASSSLAAGTWCTNGGDCITFDAQGDEYGAGGSHIEYPKGRDGTDYGDYSTLMSCAIMGTPYCESDAYLLKQDYGAFELMPGASLTNYWCNGTMRNDADDSCSDGEYHMQDFFLVVPAGSDLKGLESARYFDSDALAAAKKQKTVDANRPFLLYRDPKLYSKTTAPRDSEETPNPFVPKAPRADASDELAKFKPAPSDANAYYLVSTSGDYDWGALRDADMK